MDMLKIHKETLFCRTQINVDSYIIVKGLQKTSENF